MTHPAACPYCGGTTICMVPPDRLAQPVRLNADGSLQYGAADGIIPTSGIDSLFCFGCSSTYLIPTDIHVKYVTDGLPPQTYPHAPLKGDAGYIGADENSTLSDPQWVISHYEEGQPINLIFRPDCDEGDDVRMFHLVLSPDAALKLSMALLNASDKGLS